MPDTAPRVRLHDIATATGVAVSTVSRVFTDPDRVSPATVTTVLEAAQRLGYRRSATRDHSKTAIVMLQGITNPYLAAVATGIERQLRTAGCAMTLSLTEESADLEHAQLRGHVTRGDGFIVAARHLCDDELRAFAAATPLVLFNREIEGISSVVVDTDAGTHQIIEHLAALGHERIVYASGPQYSWSEHQRWSGLVAAAEASDIQLTRVGPYLPSLAQGTVAAEAALAHSPTAVIAFNDEIAIGLMNRLRMRGVDVPGDISVIGFDDSFGADFCQPPLTTVGGAADHAGRLAADTLLALIAGGDAGTQHRVEASLVLRQSTAHA